MWLKDRQPDVVGLQELKVTDEDFPHEPFIDARLISADIDGLDFTTVYCPNGKDVAHADYPRKLRWFDDLADLWATHHRGAHDAIICGDFNVVPDAMDSWQGASAEGTVFHTQDERRRLQAMLDLGLTDLFRDRFPEEQQFSWWDYRGGAFHRGHGLRIDFILGNQSICARTRDVRIDREYRKKKEALTASDHAPVIVELD